MKCSFSKEGTSQGAVLPAALAIGSATDGPHQGLLQEGTVETY